MSKKKNTTSQPAPNDYYTPPPLTALEEAQECIYDAWDAPTREEAIALAHKALSLSKDCADAYNLLAEEDAETVEEGLALYRKAVKAGERALGKAYFKEEQGYFWGLIETRPYMRARAGLAYTLWRLGEKQEAVEHNMEMLVLNPDDNQGIRYALLPNLIELGRIEEASKLYKEYQDDGMACWLYSRALLDFIKHGGTQASMKSLRKAMKANPHVSGFLLGTKKLPDQAPGTYSWGEESEAIIYAKWGQPAWAATDGAFEWLKSQSG